MDDLLSRATDAAGTDARTVAAQIRRCDYRTFNRDGIPDHRQTCADLARFLINDLYGAKDLNDRFIANNRGYALSDRQAAQQRISERTQLSAEIARLDFDAFRNLIDALADLTSTTQAA